MRFLPCSVLFCVLLNAPSMVSAQKKVSPLDFDDSPFTTEHSPKKMQALPRLRPRYSVSAETTARLIHERALMQARQRQARIQTRKWAGKSLLRPDMKTLRPPLAGWYWDDDFLTGAAEQYHMQWGAR